MSCVVTVTLLYICLLLSDSSKTTLLLLTIVSSLLPCCVDSQAVGTNYGRPNYVPLSVITISMTPRLHVPVTVVSRGSHVRLARSVSHHMFRHYRGPKKQAEVSVDSPNQQQSTNTPEDVNCTGRETSSSDNFKRVTAYSLIGASQWNHGIYRYPCRPKTPSISRSKSASAIVGKTESANISLILEGKQQTIEERS